MLVLVIADLLRALCPLLMPARGLTASGIGYPWMHRKTAGNPSAMSFSSRSSPCKSTIDPSAGMPGQTQRVEQEVQEQDMSEDTEMHRLCVFTSLSIMVFDLTASIQVASARVKSIDCICFETKANKQTPADGIDSVRSLP